MLRVKSRCWRCGEVNLALEDIMLVEHGDGEGIFYSFFCPTCGDVQAYPSDPRFVDFMRMNGYQPILLPDPIECKREAGSPPLTWDDLLDLHLQLESDS